MEHQSKISVATSSAPEPRDPLSQLSDDWHLTQAAHDDLRRIGMPRVNLLLAGEGPTTRSVVRMLLQDRDEPVATWSAGEPLLLPPVARGGTVVLHEVEALSHGDQLHLLDWLEHAVARTQVISTTCGPLLPRVQAGAFLETLLYRLNTVYLDVSA